jgi:hypothetical protein
MKYNPPYGITDPDGPYINGDPSIGRAGSIPPAESIEYPQREIVNLVTDAGRAPPANTDLRQLGQAVQSQLLNSDDDAGTTNQYQVTMSPPPGAYFRYMMVICKLANTNTGPVTLNVNAMGPKAVVHVDGSTLGNGELKANSITCFEYDGVNFQVAWSTGGAPQSTGGEGVSPGGPVYLTAPTDFYVNNGTGSDTIYDGTTASAVAGTTHGPFKTIQKACDQIPRYNMNGYFVTIHVADGTYGPYSARQVNGAGYVTIIGNTANPSACSIVGVNQSAAGFGYVGGTYKLRGFAYQCSGTTNPGDPLACILAAGAGTVLWIGESTFGPSLAGAIVLSEFAKSTNDPPNCIWRITGSAAGSFGPFSGAFLNAMIQAHIGNNAGGGPAIQVTTGVSYPVFVLCRAFGLVDVGYSSLTGAGSVTGQRYYAEGNSIIGVAGAGVNYWPGTIAGVTATGSQYY